MCSIFDWKSCCCFEIYIVQTENTSSGFSEYQ